jgi:signal transduction histidine kinase
VKALLYRHLQLVLALFVALLLIALGTLATLNNHNEQRIDRIRGSVEHTHLLQRAGLDMRHLQVADLTNAGPLREEALASLGAAVAPLASPGVLLVPENAERVQRVRTLLEGGAAPARERLATALEILRQTSYAELDAVSGVLDEAAADASAESTLSLTALVVLPMLLLMALWLLLRRIFYPIDNLTELLSKLANGESSPIPVHRADPLLLPLFNNYNNMISRLTELEDAHRTRAMSLEAEVRTATQALLEQHQSLARAERLAAAGEVAASIAHELRNPLAGIQMALTNLRRDLDDPSAAERLDLAVAELERISRLLKGLLDEARTTPEPPRLVSLAQVLQELLALVRYQAPPQVTLKAQVGEDLRCLLPDGQLRQALLNLVLNSMHALEGRSGTVTVAAEIAGGTLRLSVLDDGPGFPPDYLGRHVQAFRTGRSAGTGLGLAMACRFARDLGGTLDLANREPHGACATLVLPCGDRP